MRDAGTAWSCRQPEPDAVDHRGAELVLVVVLRPEGLGVEVRERPHRELDLGRLAVGDQHAGAAGRGGRERPALERGLEVLEAPEVAPRAVRGLVVVVAGPDFLPVEHERDGERLGAGRERPQGDGPGHVRDLGAGLDERELLDGDLWTADDGRLDLRRLGPGRPGELHVEEHLDPALGEHRRHAGHQRHAGDERDEPGASRAAPGPCRGGRSSCP